MHSALCPNGLAMAEPAEYLDLSSLLCDALGEELLRQFEEEVAAQKAQNGDFAMTSSSDTTKAAEEEQKPTDTKCPARGDRAPGCSPPSGTECPDTCLPSTPRKRERVIYTSDQTEILEAFYLEDCFPETEKKKFIADSLGLTVKNISIWFQNRRARRRKEDNSNRKLAAGQSRAEHTPRRHHITPILPRRKGASTLPTKMPPSRRSLLSRFSHLSQSRKKPANTSPLMVAAVTAGPTLAHCEIYLPIDTSQQSSTYNLQISYSAVQPDTSLPGTSLPGTPNFTPNPPNLTSYVLLGPEGKPTGVVSISVISVHSQSKNTQSSDQYAAAAGYQCDPKAYLSSQPAVHKGALWPPAGNCGPDEDQQPSSSISLLQPEASIFQESSHENSLDPLLKEVLTSTTTLLPPVSSPQLSCLSVGETPPEELLDPQAGAASPGRPPVSRRFEVDYEKYDKIHSHFHCDVSPTHFSF